MSIMNPLTSILVKTISYPFSYTIGLLKPQKKEQPPKEEKNEDTGGSDDIENDLSSNFIENEPSYSTFNEHDIEVNFTDRKDAVYEVRLRSKAIRDASVHINELHEFLKQNRELMNKAGNDIYKNIHHNITMNLEYNQQYDAIKKGSSKPEKGNERQAMEFAQMLEDGPRDYCQLSEKFIRPAVQNAVLARANIDMLIPLIRMRGGKVEFEGMEANPIHEHINAMRNQYVNQACAELQPPKKEEKTDEWTIEEFLIAAVIVIIIALALKLFI